LYQSLKDCRVFISNYRWGDARGFIFRCENRNGIAHIGDEIEWSDDSKFFIKLPQPAFMKLICNKREVFTGHGLEFELKAGTQGLYRAEVYVNDKGWIFSNHLRLNKKEGETLPR
jgi:hypothetical protein